MRDKYNTMAGAFLTYGYLAVADWPVKTCLIISTIVLFLITPFTLVLSIILKWSLLGKMKPGKYPLWGWFYFRYWLVRAVVRAAPVHYLDGTPFSIYITGSWAPYRQGCLYRLARPGFF